MRLIAVVFVVPLSGLSLLAQASDTEKGKKVFTQDAQPACAVCHTLADAGSTGDIGPNLDELKPSRETVVNAVTAALA